MKRVLIVLSLLLVLAVPAQGASRAVKDVVTAGLYGVMGGTVLGLISLPFTRDLRTVFMGTSIGLYLGLVVGIYHTDNYDDPRNPLSPNYQSYLMLNGQKVRPKQVPVTLSYQLYRF